MTKYDGVLIVEDFNVNVCCLEKPVVKDFFLIDSFSFMQWMFGPMHIRGQSRCHIFNPSTTVHFFILFNQCDFCLSFDTEELCSWFDFTC